MWVEELKHDDRVSPCLTLAGNMLTGQVTFSHRVSSQGLAYKNLPGNSPPSISSLLLMVSKGSGDLEDGGATILNEPRSLN